MINLRKFETEAQYDAYCNSEEYVTPNVSSISEVEGMVKYNKPHDYSKDYLKIKMRSNGIINFYHHREK